MSERDEPQDVTARDEPEQIRLMKRVVELSTEQLAQSVERTQQSADRSRMSADRSQMSADRSQMSAERSYMNAERTLSVWTRTSLALMVAGIAVDRFQLVLLQDHVARGSDAASQDVGAGLVAFGALVTLVTAERFRRYAATYRSTREVPAHHGPLVALSFAVIAGLFGITILILLLVTP